MTMKMIGLTQRLPYPGKRALRSDLAEKEADATENNLRELDLALHREKKMVAMMILMIAFMLISGHHGHVGQHAPSVPGTQSAQPHERDDAKTGTENR